MSAAAEVTISDYERHLHHNVSTLRNALRDGTYQPLPNRRKWLMKPGSKEKRPLGIPAIRDRLAQGGTRQVMEPIFEREFAENSYGFRPGRSCKDALRALFKALQEGWCHVIDPDLKSYFDTIPHDRLFASRNRSVTVVFWR